MSKDLNLDNLRKMKLENIVDLLEGKTDEEATDDVTPEGEVIAEATDVVGDAVNTLFEGQEVSAEFITKAKDIMTVLVNDKAQALMEAKLVDIEATIQTRLDEKQAASDNQIDAYLNYVVEEWLKENAVAVESNIKAERYDSLMLQLAETFSGFNVEVEKLDVLKESEDKLAALQEENEKLALALQESKEQVIKADFTKAIDAVTADLAESEKEKFIAVIGELDVELTESVESFTERLTNIKKIFVKKADVSTTVNESSTEGDVVIAEKIVVEEEASTEKPSLVNESMASYQKAIRKSFSALGSSSK